MTGSQTSRLESYIARETVLVLALLECNNAELTALVTEVQGKMGALSEQAQAQAEPTEGKTALYRERQERMVASALDVANAVAGHAHRQNLTDLAGAVTIVRRDFVHLRKLHRPWLAQRIHDAAAGVVAHLTSYEVTAETLAALQDEIDAVVASMKEPRHTIVAKKVATQNLATLFSETARLFEQIDRVVFALRKKHPGLYAAYQAARVVKDSPRRRAEGAQAEVEAMAPTTTGTAKATPPSAAALAA